MLCAHKHSYMCTYTHKQNFSWNPRGYLLWALGLQCHPLFPEMRNMGETNTFSGKDTVLHNGELCLVKNCVASDSQCGPADGDLDIDPEDLGWTPTLQSWTHWVGFGSPTTTQSVLHLQTRKKSDPSLGTILGMSAINIVVFEVCNNLQMRRTTLSLYEGTH